jgi:hypothetical protein
VLRFSSIPLARWFALACLLGALTNASARGGCGDWLEHQPSNQMPAPQRHPPCNGPDCQEAPVHPPATPLAEPYVLKKSGACTSAVLMAADWSAAAYELPLDEDRIADGYLTGILRPPRGIGLD